MRPQLMSFVESIAGRHKNPDPLEEHIYVCPFPNCRDKSGHFYVNYPKGKYVCFRCDRGGNLSTLLQKFGIDIKVDQPPLQVGWADEVRVRINNVGKPKLRSNIRPIPIPKDELPPTVPLNPESVMYLNSRGFYADVQKEYKLRALDRGPYSRVYIPCVMYGETVFWQCRAIHPDMKPKYWQKAGSRRKIVLFNYDVAARDEYRQVVICEGVFSAIRTGPHAVALFGKSCSDRQLELLCQMNKDMYYVALDGDAVKQATELTKRLWRQGKSAHMVCIPKGHDPDTYPVWNADKFLSSDFDLIRYRMGG